MSSQKNPFRVVVIDDEPPARELVKEYLAAHAGVTVVGEGASCSEAIAVINRERPDLIFLDVQMPGGMGFDVIDKLEATPAIIFCTAYDRYALDAFEVNAVDYLLKPFTRERFDRALHRGIDSTRREEESDRLLALLRYHLDKGSERAARLFVRSGKKIVPVDLNDVVRIEAEGDYTRLHTASAAHLCNVSIGDLERELDPARFARVHRSHIVALAAIRHLVSDGDGGYTAVLIDGTRVRVSRGYSGEIRRRMV